MTVSLAIVGSAFAMTALLMVGVPAMNGGLSAALIPGVSTTTISLIGVAMEIRKIVTGETAQPLFGIGGQPLKPFRFHSEQGLFGGLFGGMIAGPIAAYAYHLDIQTVAPMMTANGWEVPTLTRLMTEITVTSILIGVVLGLLSHLCADFFEYLRKQRPIVTPLLNKFTGGIVGGILAGLICGPLATWYFGKLQRPFMDFDNLLVGALPGAGIIVFSIINFGTQKIDLRILKNFIVAFVSTALVSAVAFISLDILAPSIANYIVNNIVGGAPQHLLIGGIYYGAFVGVFLGAVVGLTLVLSNTKQRPNTNT